MIELAKTAIKSVSNIHRPSHSPNIFLFATPRGGSTWLMEIIWSQPGFKCLAEPLNLRNPRVRSHLSIRTWEELYSQEEEVTKSFQKYFDAFCSGRSHFFDPNPLRGRYYRPFTNRIVFKIIHAAEDRINWLRDKFNGQVVLLLRHPIAVSLSREVCPRLETFVKSDYKRHFTPTQLKCARRIIDTGSDLERGVLSWCFQNAIPLRQAEDDWVVISYEQLVLEPVPTIKNLADKLNLPQPQKMLDQLTIPSSTTSKSDATTQGILNKSNLDARHRLISKWRDKVTDNEERSAMEILDLFNIDMYKFGETSPVNLVWKR